MPDQFSLYRQSKTENLEELTIKDNLFYNSRGQFVKVEPVGNLLVDVFETKFETKSNLETVKNKDSYIQELIKSKSPSDANAYTLAKKYQGVYLDKCRTSVCAIAIQYYKAEVPCDG